jgi:hypothetical protein
MPLVSLPDLCFDRVALFICTICERLGYQAETFELSLEILRAVSRKCEVPSSSLKLVGVVSLLLASKYHEKVTLPLSQATSLCGHSCSAADLLAIEFHVLQRLNWQVDLPTAAEISRHEAGFRACGRVRGRLLPEP